MKRNSLLIFGSLMAISVVFAGILPVMSQTAMKDKLGVDFGEDFAIVVDFNVDNNNFANFPGDVQVLDDLVNPANPQINPSDNNANYDQEYYLAHFNTSGIHNTYFALNKIEFDLKIPLIGTPIGHVKGSAPFQTLLQYYTHEGKDVFVGNTFRGYMAYTTNSTDETLDTDDKLYVGYTLVLDQFISLLNTALANAPGSYDPIPDFGYEPIYESTADSKTFGMNYTNFFVVWQDTESQLNVPGFNTDSLKGVVTGGDIVAASLFDYLTFTYTVETVEANATHTIVDVVTEYDVGPMKWLITTDSDSLYTDLVANVPEINSSNSFNLINPSILVQIQDPVPDVQIDIPDLAFYTEEAVNKRIDTAAVEGSGAEGFGIAVVTSTNVHKVGATFVAPGASTDGQAIEIPLTFGGDTVFETSFVGKATYDRTLFNGTVDPDLPIYVTTRSMEDVKNTFDLGPVADAYFKAQSLQTRGLTVFTANQLSPALAVSQSEDIKLDVDSSAYVTFVQMPKWSGLEVTQDPTYTAVSLVGGDGGDTSDTGSSVVTSTGSGTGPVPGFEALALIVAFIPLLVWKKRK